MKDKLIYIGILEIEGRVILQMDRDLPGELRQASLVTSRAKIFANVNSRA